MSNEGRTIICTVGASAIEWIERHSNLVPEVDIQALLKCFDGYGNRDEAIRWLWKFMQDYYQDDKKWPAELTSLNAIELDHKDKVIFVAGVRTDGKPDRGEICAEALSRYYNKSPWHITTRVKLVDGFVITERYDPVTNQIIKDFEDAHSMLRVLDELVAQERAITGIARPIVFNITPGYKLANIYAALVGFANECELYYTQIGMSRPFGLPKIKPQVLGQESLTETEYNKLEEEVRQLYESVPVGSSNGLRYRRKNLVNILDRMPRASWDKEKIIVHEESLPKTKVLFISADPADKERLRLGKEFSEIDRKLRSSKERENLT